MRNQFIDVSSYQPDTVTFFQAAKAQGALGVVVKLTEGSEDGSAYVNPRAAAQIRNALAVGLRVSCYHFARYTSIADAQNEARFFVKIAKQFGMYDDTLMIDDAEVHSAADYQSASLAFLQEVEALGYKNTGIYSMKSFFTGGILNSHSFDSRKIWIAGYGVTELGIDNASACNIPIIASWELIPVMTLMEHLRLVQYQAMFRKLLFQNLSWCNTSAIQQAEPTLSNQVIR